MVDDMVGPALTPEEWANPVNMQLGSDCWIKEPQSLLLSTACGCLLFDVERRHAIAALALHGQPFGFTRDDVVALWSVIRDMDPEEPERLRLVSLSARITALLPPHGT